jgi:hypothetical protein
MSLLGESKTFRGFNTTHLAPLMTSEFYKRVFDGTAAELTRHPSPRVCVKRTRPA